MQERSGAGQLMRVGAARTGARRDWLILVAAWLWCFDLAVYVELSAAALLAVVGGLGVPLLVWRRSLRAAGRGRAPEPGQMGPDLTAESCQSLFEHHPCAVFSLDFGGGFTSTNAACEQITGYATAELREMTFYDLLWRDDVLETEAGFVRALDRHPQQLDLSIVHADGHLVELAVTGLPIEVGDTVVGVLGIAEDISAAKRLERDRGRSLLDPAEELRDTSPDSGHAVLVRAPDESWTNPLQLVDQSHAFSRHEVDSCSDFTMPFDVRLLVDDLAAQIRPQAQRKGLFFKCTVDPRVPSLLEGDPAGITQALDRLLDNALRFTESGWIRLIVTSAHNFGDRASVRFEVHDSGIGVTSAGCAHQLVTSMGGALALSSSPGLGSAFSFTLRFSLPDAEATSGAQAAL